MAQNCNSILSIVDGGPLRDPLPESWGLGDILQRAGEAEPSKGIIFLFENGGEEFLSYKNLYELSKKVAGGLSLLDASKRTHAITAIRDKKNFLIAFWGCILAGVVPLPCAVPESSDSIQRNSLNYLWHALDSPLIISSSADEPTLLGAFDGNEPQFRLLTVEDLAKNDPGKKLSHRVDDVAVLIMTSGSSGHPKLVTQTHRTLKSYCAGACEFNKFNSNDVSLNWFPFDHVGGLVMFHLRDTWLICTQVQASLQAVVARPLRWLDWIDQYRVTVTWAPNFAFALLNRYANDINLGRWDLSCLRIIINGGEAIVASHANQFLSLLAIHQLPPSAMRPAWGMSETCSGVIYSDRFCPKTIFDPEGFVEVGMAIPGFSCRIVDDYGILVAQGSAGELEVRGASVTPGYYLNDVANNESFSSDGWFKTGDIGIISEERVTIVGRSSQLININGVKFGTAEVEVAASQVVGVKPGGAVAVSIRNSSSPTDRVGILLILDENSVLAPKSVLRDVSTHIMRRFHCGPPLLLVIDEKLVPRTSTGKIKRVDVAKLFERGA